jgi:anti-anti-sigma factor
VQITQEQREEVLVLKVSGRVDSYRATQLHETMEEVLSSGVDQVRIDLSEVAFLSSAGVRVLMQSYRQVKGLRGSFGVLNPSPNVVQTLDLMGTRHLLVVEDIETTRPAAALDRLMERLDSTRQEPALPEKTLSKGSAKFAAYAPTSSTPLKASLFGNPAKLTSGGYGEADCWQVSYPPYVFGLGVGAFGGNFAEARERFGEYLAAGGAITYLPTDGQNIPDYLLSLRSGVPDILSAYALTCEGTPSHFVRVQADSEEPTNLAEILEVGLEVTGSPQIGFVAVLETVGVIGAALRQSPVSGKSATLQVPDVRQWVTFTAEPAWRKNVVLLVGVASAGECRALSDILRPYGGQSPIQAHVHAAVFTYHPIGKGVLEMKASVANLLENHDLLDVMHLLNDDRPVQGAGQSEFTRGALWVGALNTGEETKQA